MTHYLSQEIVQIVQNYPQLAPRFLQLAEEHISYLLKDTDFQSAKPSKKIKTKLAQLDELLKSWQTAQPLDALQLDKMNGYFHTAYTYAVSYTHLTLPTNREV